MKFLEYSTNICNSLVTSNFPHSSRAMSSSYEVCRVNEIHNSGRRTPFRFSLLYLKAFFHQEWVACQCMVDSKSQHPAFSTVILPSAWSGSSRKNDSAITTLYACELLAFRKIMNWVLSVEVTQTMVHTIHLYQGEGSSAINRPTGNFLAI